MKTDDRYIADARERLRKKAQNEATCFALNDMLKDAQDELRRLREENERQHFDILAMNQSLDLLREENERLRENAKIIYELEQLAARSNNDLLVENERLRKDAERYRWLRDYGSTSHLVCRMFVTRYIGSATIPVYQGGALDAAIDSARGAK